VKLFTLTKIPVIMKLSKVKTTQNKHERRIKMKRYELYINGSLETKRNTLTSLLNNIYNVVGKKDIVIIDTKTKEKISIDNYYDYNKLQEIK
jgi:hypothetical protein